MNKQYGLDKIVRELNLPFSFDKVKSILKDNNIHIRNVQQAHQVNDTTVFGNRKYHINDDYCFESHNGAWLLGFYAADGYMPNTKGAKYRVTIALQERDREILERIKEEFQYDGPIYEYLSSDLDGKKFPTVSLSFTSKKIRQNFEKYGIINQKTFKLDHLPNLPEEFMLDYIRGYIDGDGTIYSKTDERKNTLTLSVTGANQIFITEMYNYLKDHLPLKYNGSLYKDHANTAFRFYATDANIICSKLYDNEYLALKRKKDYFNELRE